jgi:ferredoxin/menaquinone-dependent protoporphyrinogen IX oxidase
MDTRKTFLKKGVAAMAAIGLGGCAHETIFNSKKAMKTTRPETALVLWYSQTGHTERNGKLIGKVIEKSGLTVKTLDFRECDPLILKNYDLIIMGTPVYYLDTPENVRSWLASIPRIDGIPVAAYSTYGGPGDNQYNTAFYVLQLLAKKGGVPVGIATFGNMSTFAPTWSMGNEARILKYKNRPNEEIFAGVRNFATELLKTVRGGAALCIEKEFYVGEFLKGSLQAKIVKLMITRHTIDTAKCIGCGTCVEKCPAGSIDLARHGINKEICIACMGCVNNCPAQAIDMVFFGKKVYGFKDFLKKNRIVIQEPAELKKA